MKLHAITLAALVAASSAAHADTIALWDFNSFSCSSGCAMPKATQSTNGGVLSAVGAITFMSAAGSGSGNALNTASYPAQGTGSLTRGVQFTVDTSGYTDISLTFAQRNSATASAWTTLRYTLDGSTWQTATSFRMLASQSATFVNGITYDFSAITGANDNANFGIQLLTSFAPGTSTYLATGNGATYGTAGTIRYDNVLFSGNAIPDQPLPVPEPQTYALMLAGLATVALVARRRRAG
jgi:hypothetical protein